MGKKLILLSSSNINPHTGFFVPIAIVIKLKEYILEQINVYLSLSIGRIRQKGGDGIINECIFHFKSFPVMVIHITQATQFNLVQNLYLKFQKQKMNCAGLDKTKAAFSKKHFQISIS